MRFGGERGCLVRINGIKIMPPPWLAYPHIERGSIGWRMGYGEQYICRFCDWLNRLSQEERAEYQNLFPEPVTWSGWWEHENSGVALRQGGLCLLLWRPQGAPQYTGTWLTQEAAEGRRYDMCLFWKHHPAGDGKITESCLSQWWMQEFCYSVTKYCCMEQFMMEQKAKLFEDEETRKQIMDSRKPHEIKELGRKVRGFDQELWDAAKYSIVLNGNWRKFSQNRELRDFLLSTGDSILAEASPYDGIWGIGLDASDPDACNPFKWQGANLLGFALMEVRDELRRVTHNEELCDRSFLLET